MVTLLLVLVLSGSSPVVQRDPPNESDRPVGPPWPCRLVVAPILRPMVEDGWKHSPTFRQQCRRLADAGAVAILLARSSDRTEWLAEARIGVGDRGNTIAQVWVRFDAQAIERIAHELEHVIERTEGIDLAVEARRRPEAAWRSAGGFESRRALDAGRRVLREVLDEAPPAVTRRRP